MMKKMLIYLVATVLFVFGMITLFLSSSILFDWFGIRAKEGNYVLLIVISNFMASLIYLFAAYGFLKNKIFTIKLLYIAVALLAVGFAALVIHINMGGAYETKTIFAMEFRIALTCFFALTANLMITNKQNIGIKKF